MPYTPKPASMSKVKLPEFLEPLAEMLARNAHEVWARQRISEGWRYGPRRDDKARLHPDLVPYDELPEGEKVYDRKMSLETIKVILALGYEIRKPGQLDQSQLDGDFQTWLLAHLEHRIDHARRLIRQGNPLMALDALDEFSRVDSASESFRLLLTRSQAMARAGATHEALEISDRLRKHLPEDRSMREEALGLHARLLKDQWEQSRDPAEGTRLLKDAYFAYAAAFRDTGGYWTGINAATLGRLLDRPEAADLAEKVIGLATEDFAQAHQKQRQNCYWPVAALAEACLVLGRYQEALEWYRKAATVGKGRHGDLGSTRRNARLLLGHVDQPDLLMDIGNILAVSPVAVFTGHMIDRPGRARERFPAPLEGRVKAAIREQVADMGVSIGYASAACGADILFHEAIRQAGGESTLVLPYDAAAFRTDSVDVIPRGNWGRRFNRLFEQSPRPVLALLQKVPYGRATYQFANLVLYGLARIHSRQLDDSGVVGLAVWDGRPGDGSGGTADMVELLRRHGCPVRVIDIASLQKRSSNIYVMEPIHRPIRRSSSRRLPEPVGPHRMAVLFADVAGFSKLSEEQVRHFMREYLGSVSNLIRSVSYAPVMENTWGDGLYLAFRETREAALFALDLQELVANTPWQRKGLPERLKVRIGLHAGPVEGICDPVTNTLNYTGLNVSVAARIEPKVPAGAIYASQQFAALLACGDCTGLTCEYVGRVSLPKDFGEMPLYRLRRG